MAQVKVMHEAPLECKLLNGAQDEEVPGIRRALQEIEKITAKMGENGLSQKAFFAGVVNVAFSGFIFGRWPQHVWVLYIAKVLVLVPIWFLEVKRRHNGALWVLDFCWVSNITMGLFMLANLLEGPSINPRVQRWAFLWFFSTATGPLSWAALLLQNGLIFHSIERTASLFIHLTPCLVAWTLRWSPQEVIAAWPRQFSDQSLEQASVGELYLCGMFMYFCWLAMHALWLLTIGVDAPSKGLSTVFDGLYKKHHLGEKFRRLTGLTSIRAHAVIYLAFHALACSIAFTWSMLCYKFWLVHTAFGIVLLLSVVWIGAGYYMHIFKNAYSKALKELLPKSEV